MFDQGSGLRNIRGTAAIGSVPNGHHEPDGSRLGEAQQVELARCASEPDPDTEPHVARPLQSEAGPDAGKPRINSVLKGQHEKHKERLARLGYAATVAAPKRTRVEKVEPVWRGVDPEPYYPQMWFWGLLSPRGAVGEYIPPIKKIKRAVSVYYGISILEIDSSRRAASIVLPRQVIMYLAKKLTPFSYPQIGRQLGGRDHSTVISGVRRIEGYLKQHPAMALTLDKLEQEIMAL